MVTGSEGEVHRCSAENEQWCNAFNGPLWWKGGSEV
jgi:hypothetical protein